MKNRSNSYNLKTEQQDSLEISNQLFTGIPHTMESIDFQSVNFRKSQIHQSSNNLSSKFNYQMNKTINFQPNLTPNDKRYLRKNARSQSCIKTLRKLKEQRQILNSKKLKKMGVSDKFKFNELSLSMGSQRVASICKNVITKLKRNNIFQPALRQQYFSKFDQSFKHNGIKLKEWVINSLDLYGCLVTLLLLLSQTFSIAFTELQVTSALALVFYSLQIFLNFFLVKKTNGMNITKIKDIGYQYLHSYFIIDASIVIITLATFTTNEIILSGILLFLTVLKLPYMMDKFSKFQRGIVSSLYYQRYWSLFKIILFNFFFAHFIAIMLNLMTKNQSYNWQVVKGISAASFIQKYIWSYYWATTIMLTVGFGDIVPVSSQQAVWMIFIQIISCIAFSYNISCLGNLISNIRAQKEQVQKNRIIFQNMSKNSGFSQDLIEKVQSFIDQSVIIRNKFNIRQEKQFIQSLPLGFKQQVICQSNKNMLTKLSFFGSLLDKSIYKLSQKIQRRMYHPQQILRSFNAAYKVRILRQGKVGYICRKRSSWLPVNIISISKMQSPFLVTLEFLNRKQPNYQIKSLDYSIIHQMSEQALIQALKTISKDYQYYSFLKDKSKHIVDEFETVICDLCTTKHTHCDCPKLHYIPLKEHVVDRHLHHVKVSNNKRSTQIQRNKIYQHALDMFIKCNEGIELSRQVTVPTSKSSFKNQIIFMNLISKKTYNDASAYKQNDIIFKNNSADVQGAGSLATISLKNQFQIQQFQGEVWKLALDLSWNYEMYYPNENSLNLEKNFSLDKRMSNNNYQEDQLSLVEDQR